MIWQVADALMKMQGYPQGGYIPDLEAYSPATPGSSDQPTVVGPAFTVKVVPSERRRPFVTMQCPSSR